MRRACLWAWIVLAAPAAGRAECVEAFDPEADYFPHKAELLHAESFSIEYFGHYKLVTVHTPWPGAEEPVRYLLVQCGTPDPRGP